MFSMAARFQGPLGKIWKNSSERARKVVVVVLFLLICTFGSSIGILKLVRYGFGTLTKLTLPVTFLPLLFFVPYRIWRDKKAGMFNKDGFYIKADLSAAYPDGVPEYATVGVKEENYAPLFSLLIGRWSPPGISGRHPCCKSERNFRHGRLHSQRNQGH